MATISVKFRQSTVEGKAGTIFYQVIHRRKMARINTDIHVQPCDWRKICNRTDDNEGYLTFIRNRIDSDLSVTALIISSCEESGNAYSARTIVKLFKTKGQDKNVSCILQKGTKMSFFAAIRKCIATLKGEKRNSTAANYTHTLNSFRYFTEGRDIDVQMITPELIQCYEVWLKERGVKRNTTSFYMRILRAVHNIAVRQGHVRQVYPFRNVYTGVDTTRKRAVDEDTIVALNNLELVNKPKLQLAKDMFLFSFATCGMPFVDMVHLRHSDIKDGYIKYERRKTRQPLQVKVMPFINDIIRRYRQDQSPYIFPIIKPNDIDGASVFKQYRTALIAYNRYLQEISKMLPGGDRLTSYTSRHSWATIARDHGNTAANIGKALGHTSERSTRIYLDSINDIVVDKMNEEILGCLQRISK